MSIYYEHGRPEFGCRVGIFQGVVCLYSREPVMNIRFIFTRDSVVLLLSAIKLHK